MNGIFIMIMGFTSGTITGIMTGTILTDVNKAAGMPIIMPRP
jgi:hypothetical protein